MKGLPLINLLHYYYYCGCCYCVCIHAYVCICTYHGMYVEIREQHAEVSSFLLQYGSWVQHSGFSLDGKVLYLQAGTETTS